MCNLNSSQQKLEHIFSKVSGKYSVFYLLIVCLQKKYTSSYNSKLILLKSKAVNYDEIMIYLYTNNYVGTELGDIMFVFATSSIINVVMQASLPLYLLLLCWFLIIVD